MLDFSMKIKYNNIPHYLVIKLDKKPHRQRKLRFFGTIIMHHESCMSSNIKVSNTTLNINYSVQFAVFLR